MGHHFIYFVQKIRTHPVLKTCRCLVHRILQHCRHRRIIQLYMIHLLHQLVDLSRKRKDQIPDTCDQWRIIINKISLYNSFSVSVFEYWLTKNFRCM